MADFAFISLIEISCYFIFCPVIKLLKKKKYKKHAQESKFLFVCFDQGLLLSFFAKSFFLLSFLFFFLTYEVCFICYCVVP